ncbi:MAG TPA: hypothetical protein VLG44_00440 [Chlamydiales bacterium]|nr:hypothetical protein [Chlamydiales bacterium]
MAETPPLLTLSGTDYCLTHIKAEDGERIDGEDLLRIPFEEIKPLLEAGSRVFKIRESQEIVEKDSVLRKKSFTKAPDDWDDFQREMERVDQIARRMEIGPYRKEVQLRVFTLHGQKVLDMEVRHAFFHLPLYKRNFLLESKIHKAFLGKVKTHLQLKLGIQDDELFQRIWDEGLASREINCRENEPLTIEKLEQIEAALREAVVYLGKGIDVSAYPNDPELHEIIQFLLGRGDFSSTWLTNLQNLKGVFLEKDLRLLRGMEGELASILEYACLRMPSPQEETLFQAFVGNIISLIPYSYPEEGTTFTIPQKINGKWEAVEYQLEKRIELTPKFFSSPIVAYALVSENGPPLLTFLGTTYPAADGFVATLLADCTPFFSVGRAPYLWGKGKIAEWLQGKTGVRLFGMSLGGALCFHTLYDHREKIQSLDVYNPPGLYWKETFDGSVEVNIYYQENDLVASMGFFPEGKNVSVYRVFPEKMENPLKAHARVYTGSDRLAMLKNDPAYENRRGVRIFFTFLHFTIGILSIPLFVLTLLLQLLYRGIQYCIPKMKTC